jgi:hypothetical protein
MRGESGREAAECAAIKRDCAELWQGVVLVKKSSLIKPRNLILASPSVRRAWNGFDPPSIPELTDNALVQSDSEGLCCFA